MLPRVLHAHWPLRHGWENLFACLDRIFWKRVYVNGAYYEFPIETVRAGLDMLDADPATELPVKIAKRKRGSR
ncbi:MAG: hypothetical protein HYV17_11235 [Xanthomonadales bacterium]|nr:hypothetical protein [Xanthomonadales bacterium]